MDQQIGERLREIRTRLRLSQRQLARVSEVADAIISQIEVGELNPGVEICELISACSPPSF